jgi:hypothetical protein
MADLAVLAEGTGWDGSFVRDHLRYPAPVRDILDPYVCLAVIAATTSLITLGPMVTPLIRRRPQVVARQAVALDRQGISDGWPFLPASKPSLRPARPCGLRRLCCPGLVALGHRQGNHSPC